MSAKSNPRCPHCHGQFTAEGIETRQLPLGFGFKDSSRFQVDCIQIKSYVGWCMSCGKDGKVEFSRRHVVKYPKLGKAKVTA